MSAPELVVNEPDPRAVVLDFVRACEIEVIARVRLYLDRWEEEDTTDASEALQRAIERRRTAEDRLPADAGWHRFSRDLGLNELEQDVLRYLLCLAEGVSLRRWLEDLGDGWSRIGRIVHVLVEHPIRAFEARSLFRAEGPLMRHRLIVADHRDRSEQLLDAKVTIAADVAAAFLGDHSVFGHLCPGLEVFHPQESLEQLVVPPTVRAVLKHLIEVHRATARGVEVSLPAVSYGTSTLAFFHGPAGTGKTLAARAIAHEAGAPLVCLKVTRQRYFMSTEADELAVAISRARMDGGILLLDECDVLFGVEGESMEAAAFLAQLENAGVMVLLSTNRTASFGEAMTRRILYDVAFPLPDAPARTAIWRQHLPELKGHAEQLARRHPLSGGYIKNAAVAARQTMALQPDAPLLATVESCARYQAERAADQYDGIEPLEAAGPIRPGEQPVRQLLATARDPAIALLRSAGQVETPMALLHGADVATLRWRSGEIAAQAGFRWRVHFRATEFVSAVRPVTVARRLRSVDATVVVTLWVDDDQPTDAMSALSRSLERLGGAGAVVLLWPFPPPVPVQFGQIVAATAQVSSHADLQHALLAKVSAADFEVDLDASLRRTEVSESELGRLAVLAIGAAKARGSRTLTSEDVRPALEAIRALGGATRPTLFGAA